MVRIMSSGWLIAATKAIVSSGTPMEESTRLIMINPAPGTPAVPMAPKVAVRAIIK